MASKDSSSSLRKLLPLISCVVLSVVVQQSLSTKPISWRHSGFKRPGYHCKHSYSTEILSVDPPTLYINNFVSQHEMNYLLALSYVVQKSLLYSYYDWLMLPRQDHIIITPTRHLIKIRPQHEPPLLSSFPMTSKMTRSSPASPLVPRRSKITST